MFVVRCEGVPFEAVSANVLDSNYDGLNNMMLTVGKTTGSRLAAWCYVDHYETEFSKEFGFSYEWLGDLSQKYMRQFTKKPILETKFYIAFVLKPAMNGTLDECIKESEELQQTVSQFLAAYGCETLALYSHNGFLYSEVYEFLGYLANGRWEKIPVTAIPAYQIIQSSSLHHSYKIIETRFADRGNRFSTLYDLKDFPETTKRGILNEMLKMEFPFLLCMSLTFLAAGETLHLLDQAINKLKSAGDQADEQHEEIEDAKGRVMSGEVYFGEFHAALMVHGRTKKEAEDRGGSARTLLASSCATVMVPANLSAPSTYFSLFPGNLKYRPRPMPKSTRSLTGMFSMNTYSSGKQHGNPIGDGSAVIPLATEHNGVYHFNFHFTMPDKDTLGQKVAGHTLVLGATGAGKTTFQSTLVAFLERFKAKIFGIDKDGSMRGMIESLGGTYFRLETGVSTGFNPMQLPDTEFNRNFIYDLVAACARRPGKEFSAEDLQDIKNAVDSIFELDFAARRFGILLQAIPDRGEDCLVRRLAQWCYGQSAGRYAWVLDNPRNLFDWESFGRVGFDVSDFLVEGNAASEPILAYLFHLKSLMHRNGGLMATVVEEFWLPASFPKPQQQILDVLKTGRRRDEFIVLVSQSPEDALALPILPAILQQTATKVFLANPEAQYRTEGGGGYSRLNMTREEFARLKKIGVADRKVLIKQGSQSNVVGLNMSDCLDYISVLAMAADEFPLLAAAKAAAGDHPDAWVPRYIAMRREALSANGG